jgi:hypothetical protein
MGEDASGAPLDPDYTPAVTSSRVTAQRNGMRSASPYHLDIAGRVESVFSRPSPGVSEEEVQQKPQLGTTQ